MEKTVNQRRLRDEINKLIGQAQDGRFGDRQSAFDALEAVKYWAIDECENWNDDELSDNDLNYIALAEQEYANGETISHNDIAWKSDDDSDIDFSDIPEIDFTGIEFIRFDNKNIGVRSDKDLLLKCVDEITKITGKSISHYNVLIVDRWLHRYDLSADTIITSVKECVEVNPRSSINYINAYLGRKYLP